MSEYLPTPSLIISAYDIYIERAIRKYTTSVNYLVIEIYNGLTLQYESVFIYKIENKTLDHSNEFYDWINFERIFELIRLVGHVSDFQKSVATLIFKLISITKHNDHFIKQDIFQYLSSKLTECQQNILKVLRYDVLIGLVDTIFICHVLVMDLNLSELFNCEIITRFITMTSRLAKITDTIIKISYDIDPTTLKYLNHVKISCMKIVEKLLMTSPINDEIKDSLNKIVDLEKFLDFLKAHGHFDDIFNRLSSHLDDRNRSKLFDKIHKKTFSSEVKNVCNVLPQISPDIVESLLQTYPNPETLIYTLISNPQLAAKAPPNTSSQKSEIVFEADREDQTIDLNIDPELNKVNIRLVQIQESEAMAKILNQTDTSTGKDEDLSDDYNFDELDDDIGVKRLNDSFDDSDSVEELEDTKEPSLSRAPIQVIDLPLDEPPLTYSRGSSSRRPWRRPFFRSSGRRGVGRSFRR